MATRKKIAPPNLLTVPKFYDWRYQELLNNVQRLFYSAVANQINSPSPYGAYYCTVTQTNPTANEVHLVPFDSSIGTAYETAAGVDNSRIYVTETGIYTLLFSVQANVDTGGGAEKLFLWIRVNGQDVPNSTFKVVVDGPNSETLAAWNYVLPLKANDYIELAWTSSGDHMILQAEDKTSTTPATPAVIFTVCWVSSLNISTGLS